MVGLPGAGKTTAAKVIAEATNAVHLWADDQRKQRFVSPAFDEAENNSLYEQLNSETALLLGQGKNVVFDTAFNHFKDRQKLRVVADEHRARTLVVWVQTPSEVARERATRNTKSQPTRILGDMTHGHFDKLSQKLEEPRKGEETIILDGTKITADYVKQNLTNV